MKVKTIIGANPTFKKETPDKEAFIEIAEFFYDTIQGEGINTGHPSAFLRVQHCTQNCVWCFHPNTHIQTLNGIKKIKDVQEGETLLTLDEKENMVETTVQGTMKRKVDIKEHILKITFGNKTDKPLVCTKNHWLYVKGKGWTDAKDINKGDTIISLPKNASSSYKMRKDNPMNKKEVADKMSKTSRERYARGEITSYERTEYHRQLNSDLKKGERNPMKDHEVRKRNTLSHNYDRSSLEKQYEEVFLEHNLPIAFCENKRFIGDAKKGFAFPDFEVKGTNKVIEVYDTTYPHYKQGVRTKENYEIPRKEHFEEFGFECLFLTEQDLKDEAFQHKVFPFAFNGQEVTNIESADNISSKAYARLFGSTHAETTEVYNLSCAPYNTYIANSAYVHNCDTQEVWRFGNPYTLDEIFELIDQTDLVKKLQDGQHLILTGGSPLKQQDRLIRFIDAFIERYNFKPYIEIENECTLPPRPKMKEYVDCWNNSPKLSNSGNLDILRYQPPILKELAALPNSWFKFVVTNDEDWEEIQRDFLSPELISWEQVILMPQGANRKELYENREYVADMAVENNVKYCSREHVVLWDMKTGV